MVVIGLYAAYNVVSIAPFFPNACHNKKKLIAINGWCALVLFFFQMFCVLKTFAGDFLRLCI